MLNSKYEEFYKVISEYKPIYTLAYENIYGLREYRHTRNIDSKEQFINRKNILLEEYEELKEAINNSNTHGTLDAYADIIVVCINAIEGVETFNIYNGNEVLFRILVDTSYLPSDNGLELLISSYCRDDLTNTNEYDKYDYLNGLIIYTCLSGINACGYYPNGILNEVVKHILSREQDPVQKEEWDKGNRTGKWLKNKNQDVNTLYYPNFEKYKKQ